MGCLADDALPDANSKQARHEVAVDIPPRKGKPRRSADT